MAQDSVEKAFLAELEALEKFRISYTSQYPNVPLAREDPDVRRLIEAMAMFTARTRVAAERSVAESLLRLFRQHFPQVLSPVPAMGMIQARPTARYVDVTEIPRGTEIVLSQRQSGDAPDRVWRFRTAAALRVLPIELVSVDIFRMRGRGHRIVLRFESAFPRNDDIGRLSLQVNHLDDVRSSMTVLHALKSHVRAASVAYERVVREDTAGTACTLRFGAHDTPDEDLEPFDHAVQRFRSFLRFPQEELFLHVDGVKPPRNWQHFTLCLDVDEAWPTELRLTKDAFRLHVVPILNLRHEMANPIEWDGTREKMPIRNPDPNGGYVLHSVLGVYKMTEKGLVPLEPAVLGARRESYDVLVEGEDDERRAFVALQLPDAFEHPERVAVDAYWHQPSLRAIPSGDLRVRPSDRHLEGVDWELSGAIVGHGSSTIASDKEQLLKLLSIKSQRFLGVDELTFLLRALGAQDERAFAKLVFAIQTVTVASKPFARRSNAFKYVYDVELANLDPSDLARVDLFSRRLLELLSAWSVEEVVELVVRLPNLGKELRFS